MKLWTILFISTLFLTTITAMYIDTRERARNRRLLVEMEPTPTPYPEEEARPSRLKVTSVTPWRNSLSWQPVHNAASYIVQFKDKKYADTLWRWRVWNDLAITTHPEARHNSLTAGQTYLYRVRARKPGGQEFGRWSALFELTMPPQPTPTHDPDLPPPPKAQAPPSDKPDKPPNR